MLKITELICGYKPDKPVIGPLSFTVEKGEIVCLIGPNGIGKTTLFKTILGILKPIRGNITLNGKPYHKYSPKEFARTVAYVPQGHIPPFPYAVKDVVVMGCNPHMHELSSPSRENYIHAEEMLELMGIHHLADRDYTEISGGERQMVLIARALAQNTNLLIMDEPTTHLDFGNETKVLSEVKKLAGLGYTIVMITHMPNHAFLCDDKVLAVGKDGYFTIGSPDKVLTEEVLMQLYGTDIQISDVELRSDHRHVKVCTPLMI